MQHITRMVLSTVGKKYLMAITGLAMVGFACGHLVGNLQLFMPPAWEEHYLLGFNKYGHHLVVMGPILWAIELGLIAIAMVHIVVAIIVNLSAMSARSASYDMERTKGGESKSNLSSKHMLIIGSMVGIFIIFHLWHFKYGPGIEAGYVVKLHGEEVRDLHRLVIEEFNKPWVVFVYVGFMVFLGFHLRHGIWSMFQSLGAMPGKYSKCLYTAGVALAILVALGFMLMPLWVCFDPFHYREALMEASQLVNLGAGK